MSYLIEANHLRKQYDKKKQPALHFLQIFIRIFPVKPHLKC